MKKLGFGCMRLPVFDGDVTKIDDAMVCRMVDAFMEQGFTYFDTAYPYHNEHSEAAVKRCLVDRYERDRFVLADKMPVWMVKKYEDFRPIFDVQLERCGVTYFDYYLLHALDANRIEQLEEQGGFRFLSEMKEAGFIRNIGFSFHDTADVLEKVLSAHPEVDFVQLQINYYDWDSESVQSRLCYECATRHNVPVVVMEPIKGGTLANLSDAPAKILKDLNPKNNLSIASYAIRFVASLENVFMVLSGMSDEAQMLDNLSYMKEFEPLTKEEQTAITQVVEELKKLPTIPCTKCSYCVADCPKQIRIPHLFEAYNHMVQFGDSAITRRRFTDAMGEGKVRPEACIKCGKCEGHCPQHLEIRSLLEQVGKTFA